MDAAEKIPSTTTMHANSASARRDLVCDRDAKVRVGAKLALNEVPSGIVRLLLLGTS